MNRNLKLVVNNLKKDEEIKYFFEKNELKIILDLYAKMVSEGYLEDKKYLKAEKILAKHDENYMPPEVKEAMQGN